ncbi:MAG TPA: hypothetical protein VNA88_17155 [Candidatus Kapabacteria bacterium]|nr:hypothetical protein [Candidatus Kapabacteria bacterium]
MKIPSISRTTFPSVCSILWLAIGAVSAAIPLAAQSPAIAPDVGAGRGILAGDAAQPVVPTAATPDNEQTLPCVVLCFVADSVAPGPLAARFARLAGGSHSLNDAEHDRWRNYAAEQRYERDSVPAGATIAEGIVFDESDGQSRAAGLFGGGAIELVLVGHLEEAEMPQAHPDSTVLWVDVVYAGVLSTYAIRARELLPRSPSERHERYQQVRVRLDSIHGDPALPRVRVRFAGAATVALNRMELRAVPASPDR